MPPPPKFWNANSQSECEYTPRGRDSAPKMSMGYWSLKDAGKVKFVMLVHNLRNFTLEMYSPPPNWRKMRHFPSLAYATLLQNAQTLWLIAPPALSQFMNFLTGLVDWYFPFGGRGCGYNPFFRPPPLRHCGWCFFQKIDESVIFWHSFKVWAEMCSNCLPKRSLQASRFVFSR